MDHRRQRSTARQVVVEVFAVLVSLAVALAVTVGVVGLQIQDTRASVANAKSTVDSADAGVLIDSLAAVRSNVQGLSEYSNSPAWLAMQYMPRIGDPIRESTAVLNAANRVSQASADFDSVLREISEAKAVPNQVIPVEALTQVVPAASNLAAAIVNLGNVVDTIDPDVFPAAVQNRLSDALAVARPLLPRLGQLVAAMPVLTKLFGATGTQEWFIAFQNGGESRGTGGLVGSFATVNLSQGRITSKYVADNGKLTAKANPSLLPADTQQLWGKARLAEVYGVNLSPNYPYAGELLSSMWKEQTKKLPDAVLALDQRVTVELIGAVGGLDVGGVHITKSNALYWLTVGAYQRYSGVDKDTFINSMIEQLMQKLMSGKGRSLDLLSALVPGVIEGRVLLWAADGASEKALAPSAVGGQVPDQQGPFAMAVVNNNAGNKMDTFLHTSVAYQGGECVVGGRRVRVSVDLFNNPPATLPSYVNGRTDRKILFGQSGLGDGSNRVRLAVYIPQGAYIIGSDPAFLYTGQERNHRVAMFGVELAKGQRRSVTIDFTMFGDSDVVNQQPVVPAQPMLNAQQISVARGPVC